MVSPAAALSWEVTAQGPKALEVCHQCIFGGAKFNRLSLVVFELRTLSSRSGGTSGTQCALRAPGRFISRNA